MEASHRRDRDRYEAWLKDCKENYAGEKEKNIAIISIRVKKGLRRLQVKEHVKMWIEDQRKAYVET